MACGTRVAKVVRYAHGSLLPLHAACGPGGRAGSADVSPGAIPALRLRRTPRRLALATHFCSAAALRSAHAARLLPPGAQGPTVGVVDSRGRPLHPPRPQRFGPGAVIAFVVAFVAALALAGYLAVRCDACHVSIVIMPPLCFADGCTPPAQHAPPSAAQPSGAAAFADGGTGARGARRGA